MSIASRLFETTGLMASQTPDKATIQCAFRGRGGPIREKIVYNPGDAESVNRALKVVKGVPIETNPVCQSQCDQVCHL